MEQEKNIFFDLNKCDLVKGAEIVFNQDNSRTELLRILKGEDVNSNRFY